MLTLKKELQKKMFEIQSLKERLKVNTDGLERVKEEESGFEKTLKMDLRAQEILTFLYEKLNERGLNELDKLISDALGQVFPNRVYEVFHEISQERGSNNLNFFLKETKDDGIVISNIRNAVGGGIRAIVGLICLSFYLMKENAERFICMDEALSQLSDSVIEDLFSLMKALGKEAGFSFLLVTHDQRFFPYLSKIYEVKSNGILSKIKDEG